MDYASFLLYRAVRKFCSWLPIRWVFLLGRFFGASAYWLAPPYRKLVLANLSLAFDGEKDAREIRALAREHFANLGANLLSSLKLATMSRDEILAVVTMENTEIVERVIYEHGGFVFVVSHLGNWELHSQLAPIAFRCQCGTIYQRLGNPYIDADVRKSRARHGLETFERKEGFAGAMRLLRARGGVGVLVDQHAGDAGLWTPFFGRLASTSPLAATLAIRTGAALLPAAIYTVGVARWRFVVGEAVFAVDRNSDQLTATINETLEQQIRVSPKDWFWVHKRWKTPAPKFLLATYKRGVVLPDDFPATRLKPFRILIRSTNWLGDAVMSVPAVRAIKRGRPDAHVTILTRAKLVDFWKTVPEVDEVIAIEKGEGTWRVARKIAAKNFDAAVLFPNSVRSALEVWLARIPRRVGYRAKWRDKLLNQFADEKKREKQTRPPRHQMFNYLQIAESIGADISAAETFLQPPLPQTSTTARIGICPGAEYGPAKRWLPERFAEAAQRVAAARDCEWVIFGVEKDREIGAQISAALGDRCTDLTGKTTLAELIEQLRACRLLLTNDTGTMHLAAHLGVPVVAIFGSTEPALTGPIGARHRVLRHHVVCSPCFLRECPLDFRCMKSVGVDEVADAVLAAL